MFPSTLSGALFFRVHYLVIVMYTILCIDDKFDTCSLTEYSSLETAQKEAQQLKSDYPDACIEIHDDSGFISEIK